MELDQIIDNFIWGSTSFSVGIWVGGGVTPNRLDDSWAGNRPLYGALKILEGEEGNGEPAQVLNCPACNTILSIPEMGLAPGCYVLHFVIKSEIGSKDIINYLKKTNFANNICVTSIDVTENLDDYYTLIVNIDTAHNIKENDVEDLWRSIQAYTSNQVTLIPARASRPGYFFKTYRNQRGTLKNYDFEIYCPNPTCPLQRPWCGGSPSGSINATRPGANTPRGGIFDIPNFPDRNMLRYVQEPFRNNYPYLSDRIPITAYTVDEQIYFNLPSMMIATVDKFARPPFEKRSSRR